MVWADAPLLLLLAAGAAVFLSFAAESFGTWPAAKDSNTGVATSDHADFPVGRSVTVPSSAPLL